MTQLRAGGTVLAEEAPGVLTRERRARHLAAVVQTYSVPTPLSIVQSRGQRRDSSADHQRDAGCFSYDDES
jgi:hypothetical protein